VQFFSCKIQCVSCNLTFVKAFVSVAIIAGKQLRFPNCGACSATCACSFLLSLPEHVCVCVRKHMRFPNCGACSATCACSFLLSLPEHVCVCVCVRTQAHALPKLWGLHCNLCMLFPFIFDRACVCVLMWLQAIARPPRNRGLQCDLCDKAIERNVMRCGACKRSFHLECLAADWALQVGGSAVSCHPSVH
jgi:hypothetical protein